MVDYYKFIDEYLDKRVRTSKKVPVIRSCYGEFEDCFDWAWVCSSPRNVKQSRIDLIKVGETEGMNAIKSDKHYQGEYDDRLDFESSTLT